MPELSLPYRDVKPQGAADFYFAINATFAHIRDTYGAEACTGTGSTSGVTINAPCGNCGQKAGYPRSRHSGATSSASSRAERWW